MAGEVLFPPSPVVAPALEIATLDGEAMNDQPAKGHPTIVVFVATWCGVCRKATPELAAFVAKRPDVQLVIVDVGENPKRVQAFFQQFPPPPGALVGVDPQARAARAYGQKAFPTIFVLDTDGKLRARWEGRLGGGAGALRRVVGKALSGRSGSPPATDPSAPKSRHEPGAPAPDSTAAEDERARKMGVEVLR